jgi:hypothetical protein
MQLPNEKIVHSSAVHIVSEAERSAFKQAPRKKENEREGPPYWGFNELLDFLPLQQ